MLAGWPAWVVFLFFIPATYPVLFQLPFTFFPYFSQQLKK
jgi:hypothetical protein